VISYCIACYRPAYCSQLIDQLIEKTSVPYEILTWINVLDHGFEQLLRHRQEAGAPIRVVGRTPQNIGMAAYPLLFAASKFDQVVQIDDDVVCISPLIAEKAQMVFDRFPQVGMLTADCWQDEFTNGARPPMHHYREFNPECGLYDGPIDGWFAIYRRDSLLACGELGSSRYFPIGCVVKSRLASMHQIGLLCTRIKVFHATGAAYAAYFGMLDAEIAKYYSLGLRDLADLYVRERVKLPSRSELVRRVENIRASLAQAP
jgi:hypothetical protein